MNLISDYEWAMKPGYFERWNEAEQARIDADIEVNRKGDFIYRHPEMPPHAEVRVKQISHDFIFGAHIFNFDQLGTDERNAKYKALYGTLFNSATIAFYWQPFEPQEGKRRFAVGPEDSAAFWNSCPDPKNQAHWRRPPTDPVVEFCEKKGIRRHGHPLIWNSATWQYPKFILERLPKSVLVDLLTDVRCGTNLAMRDANELEKVCPGFTAYLNQAFDDRIKYIAEHYGDRINSWDVCNESAYELTMKTYRKDGLMWGYNGRPMPGDYTYKAFQSAMKYLPASAKLNINDWHMHEDYVTQTNDLRSRNCKIDIMGAQMHLFNPQTCLDIADGISDVQSPKSVRETFDLLSKAGLPIHLSEITITSPNNDERGQAIQAVIARNLYRLWFSLKPMMGITWWNVVDDCGAPQEPSVSGLFSRNMEPKPSGLVLQDLLMREWRTNLELVADAGGKINFRGFRGKYLISWQDKNGCEHLESVLLN